MSITAAPLRPVRKATLIRLWAGIAGVVLAGGAVAWAGTADVVEQKAGSAEWMAANAGRKGVITTASGLQYQVLKEGTGASPTDEDVTLIGYKGSLRSGAVFDENPKVPMPVAGVVPGFAEGLKLMKVGGEYRLWIPPQLGYGPADQTNPQTGEVSIPGDSVLIFDVTMHDFKSRAEIEAMQAQMQAQQGGAPMPGQMPEGIPQP